MNLNNQYPELSPLTKGASFSQLFDLFRKAAILRYSTISMLRTVCSNKMATKGKAETLIKLGYFIQHDSVLTVTPKLLKLLEKLGDHPKLYAPPARGEGRELYNQKAICKLFEHKHYRHIFYPDFRYLIPDGLLVLADGNNYQLNFLEIEVDKPSWEAHLENKRHNYERLARDEAVYTYWKHYGPLLGLTAPPIKDFKFQVLCLGAERREWHGWKFEELEY